MQAKSGRSALALGALGVVFGDIGTSPLYAFSTIFSEPHNLAVNEVRLYGALSLVFWTLTLIVGVKYILIVMRADNDGEGGIMALAALVRSLNLRRTAPFLALGVFGAALFYGDSVITPAISVLSAIEGVETVAPDLAHLVVPVATVILVALFAVQRFGTAKVGAAFGPIMLLWFVVIAGLGLVSVAQTPGVMRALLPTYAFNWIASEPLIAFLALGSVILCVTGAEALFADLGHFGAGPIRFSWFALVFPALLLNYLGQAALVERDAKAIVDPFYLLAPQTLRVPLIVLATLATVIASQAVITGAFSMTEQAVRLRYLPHISIRHTSAQHRGQIYIPAVNWVLMIAVVGLVAGFQQSHRLAAAYGLAVSGTFLITTILTILVARHRWRTKPLVVVLVGGLFLVIDSAFLSANLTKFTHGAWFPLLIAGILFTLLMTWSRGRMLLHEHRARHAYSAADLGNRLVAPGVARVPGTMIYLTLDDRPPTALMQQLEVLRVAHRNLIQVHFLVEPVPKVPWPDQLELTRLPHGFTLAIVHLGFMQRASIHQVLQRLRAEEVPLDPDYRFTVYRSVVTTGGGGKMAAWRKRLFGLMIRNANDPAQFFRLPPERVIEVSELTRL